MSEYKIIKELNRKGELETSVHLIELRSCIQALFCGELNDYQINLVGLRKAD